jgi:integrase
MAYIRKDGKVWRVQMMVKGQRLSGTFQSKVEAEAWIVRTRTELLALSSGQGSHVKTLRQVLERYRDEVTPTKRGHRWETVRINSWLESADHKALPLDKPLAEIRPEHLADWRDSRLSQRKAANTVLREIGVMSAVFEHARREWKWADFNAVNDIRKPRQPDHRDRVITDAEVAAVVAQLGYAEDAPVTTASQAVAVGFLLALETGMRCGEVFGLKWADVAPSFVRLRQTKTKPREVPLSEAAQGLIERMKGRDTVEVFAVPVRSVDTLFRRARMRAGLEGFTFHDSRHTAATKIVNAGKLGVLELCKMFGWSSTTQALTYFNPKAEDLAKKL